VIQDVYLPEDSMIERLADSKVGKSIIPMTAPGIHEGYSGRIFYAKASLQSIQLIDKETKVLVDPETIPQYFSVCRLATQDDVEHIYSTTPTSMHIGTLRGIPDFTIPIDLDKLTEKPFALFGRTGVGKSILNKILCTCLLAKDIASLFIFDMHTEYGLYSRTDNTPGLKFFHPDKVELFTLDPDNNKEAKPFIIDPAAIEPGDLIVAFQDLSERMIDAIYEIDQRKHGLDLLKAIENATADAFPRIASSTLRGLQGRARRLHRFNFVRPLPSGTKETFDQLGELLRHKKSIVLDFGKYGTDSMAYLFVGNLISRRMYNLYTSEQNLPRLVLFIEEAHKFLDPRVASYTIMDRLAREMRKFNLVLMLIDQRPSRIDDEVRSQLANRLILSLKEPKDISDALSGVPNAPLWGNIIGTIPPRVVLVVGDAIRVPTLIETVTYAPDTMKALMAQYKTAGEPDQLTEDQIEKLVAEAEDLFKPAG
jgi:DNA helicase HerA-like ATPase